MKYLGTRLKELRKELNKSQSFVAHDLSIGQTTYAGYELDKSEPSNEMLITLSDYYNVSTDYLLGHSNVKATQAEVDFSNKIEIKGIEQMIKEYNLTLGDETMDPGEEKKLVKLIKLFTESNN